MKPRSIALAFVAGVLAGCMASGPPISAQSPANPAHAPGGSPGANVLIIDRGDLSIGTTVQFSRVPTASEIHDAAELLGLTNLVLALPSWPLDTEPLVALEQVPPETQVVVVLPGYPPNHLAADLWNHVGARLRIVVVVPGPPPSQAVLDDLNLMRGLERVIAQMDQPARYGFERLQRPLSFRRVVD